MTLAQPVRAMAADGASWDREHPRRIVDPFEVRTAASPDALLSASNRTHQHPLGV
jgi:hypothetical protein